MSKSVLSVENVTMQFGGVVAVDNLSLEVNEGEIVEKDENHLKIDLGYCPLVKAWQGLTDDEEYMSRICDCCMDMDRAMAEGLGWTMDLEHTIAAGDGKCTMCFRKK